MAILSTFSGNYEIEFGDTLRGGITPRVRSPVCAVDAAGIPAEIRDAPYWLTWRYEDRPNGQPAKKPYHPGTGTPANVTDLRTCTSFEAAYEAYRRRGDAGIGYVLHPRQPYAALDIDCCRDESGRWNPLAEQVLRDFGTYAELSPGGRGVHVLLRGRLDPAGPNRVDGLELYDRARFVTVTGHRIEGCPPTIRDCSEQLLRLQRSLRKPQAARAGWLPSPGRPAGGGFSGSDEQLLNRAFAAANGERVRRRWEGFCKPGESWSQSLFSLSLLLAFWTGPDPARLERLLRGSPAWAASESERVKWDSGRGDSTWGLLYIVGTAIASCTSFYTGSSGVPLGTPTKLGAVVLAVVLAVDRGECPPGVERIAPKRRDLRNALRRLASVCWHLSRAWPDGEFPLHLEAASRSMNKSLASVSNWLAALSELGVIKRTAKGSNLTGRASTYRWLGLAHLPPVPES